MHKAKAVIITCMDFRFYTAIRDYITQHDLSGSVDRIIIAGGSRDFICPVREEFSNYVWTQLQLSIELHDPDEIIFIDHQDCGGYAQDGLIPKGLDKNKDKIEHTKHLKKLHKILSKKFPNKIVKYLFLGLDHSIEVIAID